MRHIYTLLLYLIAPLVVLRLLWRGLRSPAYWHRWKERFGFLPFEVKGEAIWIHAVSVGEVQASTPLVSALRERYPGRTVVVTTTTPTGSQRITAALGDSVRHAYLCYDTPGMVRRFLDQLHPAIAIVMENEIWPNLYHQCARRGIPVVIANGRLSPRSASRYRRIPALTREALAHVAAVAAQSEVHAGRFAAIGMDTSRIQVTGSIKFDVKLPVSLKEEAAVIRRQWGVNRSVWIAASTHEGEEETILRAFHRVREALPNALLVLVPRHPERFAKVANLCRRYGFQVVLRSEAPGVRRRHLRYSSATAWGSWWSFTPPPTWPSSAGPWSRWGDTISWSPPHWASPSSPGLTFTTSKRSPKNYAPRAPAARSRMSIKWRTRSSTCSMMRI